MISSLRGTVAHTEAEAIVLDIGGVGLSVAVTPDVARTARVGETLFLHTMLIVREDALSLVGFSHREELATFQLLLGVSGVGPKSALGVLSAMTAEQVAEAVAADDDAPFRRVSGIGPKTAKLIVVQLAGKVFASAPTTSAPVSAGGRKEAVTAALTGLGWAERRAADAAVEADSAAAPDATVPEVLRLALALLGPARSESARG